MMGMIGIVVMIWVALMVLGMVAGLLQFFGQVIIDTARDLFSSK